MASPEIVAFKGTADSPRDLFLPPVIASRTLNSPKFSRSQEVSSKHASVTHKHFLSTIKLFYPSLFCLLFPFQILSFSRKFCYSIGNIKFFHFWYSIKGKFLTLIICTANVNQHNVAYKLCYSSSITCLSYLLLNFQIKSIMEESMYPKHIY